MVIWKRIGEVRVWQNAKEWKTKMREWMKNHCWLQFLKSHWAGCGGVGGRDSQMCGGHVAVKGSGRIVDVCEWIRLMGRGVMVLIFFFEVIQRRGNKLINPAWPGQRWHPGPVWRAGATPGGWCCLLKTDGGTCLPFQARESEWQRFLRRGPRELWLLPGSSACGSRSDTKGV